MKTRRNPQDFATIVVSKPLHRDLEDIVFALGRRLGRKATFEEAIRSLMTTIPNTKKE